MKTLSCLGLILLSCSGCFNIHLYAPHGMDVTLLSAEDPVEVTRQWRTWFVVWGLTDLTYAMPDEQIRRENLTEVRVTTEDNIPDAFHGILYNVLIPIGLVTQTLILEGNRPPKEEPAAANQPPESKGE